MPVPSKSTAPKITSTFQAAQTVPIIPSAPDLTDHIIYPTTGHYRFPITTGGQSDVYRADLNGRNVAVKVMRYFEMHGEERKRKLERGIAREMRVWANLKHPNIIPFLGLCYFPNSSDNFSLVSPWMDNGTAIAYVRNKSDVDRLPIILGVFRGIRYLHENHIVHGDIKPSNILMSDSGVPLLCDFGLAKLQPGGGDTTTLRSADMMVVTVSTASQGGTARYMAPELFERLDPERSAKPSYQSDVWAFGCFVLEIVTLLPPYAACISAPQATFAIVDGELPYEHSADPTSSHSAFPDAFKSYPGLWFLCLRCWDTDVGQRATLSEIRKWLRSHTQYRGPPAVQRDNAVKTGATNLNATPARRGIRQPANIPAPKPNLPRSRIHDDSEDEYHLSDLKWQINMNSQLAGPESPGLLLLQTKLSKAYLELHRYKEAEALGRSVLEINRRVRGVNHMNTLDCMQEVMGILKGCGLLDEAAEMGLDLVQRRRKVQGDNDPRTHESVEAYCGILRELGRDEEARRWERILEIPVKHLELFDRLYSLNL
ncbi:kinase-like protein [Sistotremastrum niveocremeum HHB9708]|uniref:Kinase-like protein n=1 Tax=Sistotremastrum niveocremeum HHB9708 TaxID=1314777 RepID=A0A164Y3S3_9AGAM|nr:kinase-like protein [Sistotremastrum niveocremeum HHB9708]